MKDYEEMAREVLQERDRILGRRLKRRRIAEKCCAGVCCLGVAAILSVRALSGNDLMKPVPDKGLVTATTAVTTGQVTAVTDKAQGTSTAVTRRTAAVTVGTSVLTETQTAAVQTAVQPVTRTAVVTAVSTVTDAVTVTTDGGNFAPAIDTSTGPEGEKPVETTVTTVSHQGVQVPWAMRPFELKYDEFFTQVGKYDSFRARMDVPAEIVGEFFCEGTLCGYDELNFRAKNTAGTAYEVIGQSAEEILAVQGVEREDFFLYFRNDVVDERKYEILTELNIMF